MTALLLRACPQRRVKRRPPSFGGFMTACSRFPALPLDPLYTRVPHVLGNQDGACFAETIEKEDR